MTEINLELVIPEFFYVENVDTKRDIDRSLVFLYLAREDVRRKSQIVPMGDMYDDIGPEETPEHFTGTLNPIPSPTLPPSRSHAPAPDHYDQIDELPEDVVRRSQDYHQMDLADVERCRREHEKKVYRRLRNESDAYDHVDIEDVESSREEEENKIYRGLNQQHGNGQENTRGKY